MLSLIFVAVIAFGAVWLISGDAVAKRVSSAPASLLDVSHASRDRGHHLAESVTGCIFCHGSKLQGKVFVDDDSSFTLYAPNLTSGLGGVGQSYTNADFERAIRGGVRPDGTRLLIMPSWSFALLSDEDAAAIVAYVRSMPPEDHETPPLTLHPIGRFLVATGTLPFDADRITQENPKPRSVEPAADATYGRYLARIAGCMECHGQGISGDHGRSNLTPTGIGAWSFADFARTIRTGRDPSGHRLQEPMPWMVYAGMTDGELSALYAFLRTVPPRASGSN